jgi:hypothetical protein
VPERAVWAAASSASSRRVAIDEMAVIVDVATG